MRGWGQWQILLLHPDPPLEPGGPTQAVLMLRHSNTDTELRRPMAARSGLPGRREQILPPVEEILVVAWGG